MLSGILKGLDKLDKKFSTAVAKTVKQTAQRAETYVASTSVGKSYGIKPELQAQIKGRKKQLDDLHKTVKAYKAVKHAPKIKKALNSLVKQGHEVIDDLLSDRYIDPVVEVVGNHVADFDSVDAFKQKVLSSEYVDELQEYALNLVGEQNYKTLSQLLEKIQNFESLPKKEQLALLESLRKEALVKEIKAKSASLDIDEVKKDITGIAEDLCEELKLTQDEKLSIIDVFERLCQKHLDAINKSRLSLVAQLPSFLAEQLQRLETAHPELAVEQPSPKTVTHQHKGRKKGVGAKAADKEKSAKAAPSEKQDKAALKHSTAKNKKR